MFNIKLNPLWSKTVLVITFCFLLFLSSYVLIDPKGRPLVNNKTGIELMWEWLDKYHLSQ